MTIFERYNWTYRIHNYDGSSYYMSAKDVAQLIADAGKRGTWGCNKIYPKIAWIERI